MSSGYPLRGNIYWANLEPVKGSEQGGFRPVFIVSNNLMNQKAHIVIAIPMTSKTKAKPLPFNIAYEESDYSFDPNAVQELKEDGHIFVHEPGFILCNQARAISKTRLVKKIGEFTSNDVSKKVAVAIIDTYGLNTCTACEMPLMPNSTRCMNRECGKVHSIKCPDCKEISPLKFRFCPNCGRSLKE